MKKLLLTALLLIPITFIGCGKSDAKGVSLNENNTNTESTTITPKTIPVHFSVSDKTYYPSNFVVSKSSTYFPNPDNNGKITYIDNKKIQKDISSDLNNFYENYASSLAFNNDIIYFSDWKKNDPLKQINLINEEVTQLNSMPAKDLVFADDNVFFINSRTKELFSYDTKSKKTLRLTSDKVGRFIVNGKTVLYQNLNDDLKLYAIGEDGKNRIKLSDYPVQSFIPYDKNILFINPSDNNSVYLLDVATSKAKRVAKINGEDLKMYKKDIIFLNKDANNTVCSIKLDIKNDTYKVSTVISESVNEFYPTDEGIFYLPSINVNRFQYKK